MKNQIFITALFLLNVYLLGAQNSAYFLESNNYERINKFSNNIQVTYKKHLETYKYEPRKLRLDQELFANYSVLSDKRIVDQGDVLFNKSLDDFFDNIKNEIIRDKKELDFNIYVLQSAYINAFASDNGNIFFTTGLLSRLSTEAQIAAVLCHELSHYALKHNIKGFTNTKRKELNLNDFMGDSLASNERLKKHNYSQQLELQADSFGFEMLKNAGYNPSAFLEVFDILAKADLPYKNDLLQFSIPLIDLSFKEYFSLDENFENDLDSIKVLESSSHPSLAAREDYIKTLINKNGANKSFITTTETEYLALKVKVEYTMAMVFVLEIAPIEGFCHNLMLRKTHTNDAFIDFFLVQNFFQISQLSWEEQAYKHGDFRVLKELANRMSTFEKALINYSLALHLYNKYGENSKTMWALTRGFEYLKHVGVSKFSDLETAALTDSNKLEIKSLLVKIVESEFNLLQELVEKSKQTITTENDINWQEGVLIINPQVFSIDDTHPSIIDAKKILKMNRKFSGHSKKIFSKLKIQNKSISTFQTENSYDHIKLIRVGMELSELDLELLSIKDFENINSFNINYTLKTLNEYYDERYCITAFGALLREVDPQKRGLNWGLGLLSLPVFQSLPRSIIVPIINDTKAVIYINVYDLELKKTVYENVTWSYKVINNEATLHAALLKSLDEIVE